MTSEARAHSVHDRLLAKARSIKSDFNTILTRYSLERFLYRMFTSRHGEQFVLKGALLFDLWYDAPRRPTRDADLLALESRDIEGMAAIFRELCDSPCEDGMRFLKDSVHVTEIREQARYGGIRVELLGMLGTARCPVQIDVGYGDVVSPAVERIRQRPILDDSLAAIMTAYPRETSIAEKMEAVVSLGMANSRMKDFFDLFLLVADFHYERASIANAIRLTFERRGTRIPESLPIGLSDEFAQDKAKQMQWKAFLTKTRLEAPSLDHVIHSLRVFWTDTLGISTPTVD